MKAIWISALLGLFAGVVRGEEPSATRAVQPAVSEAVHLVVEIGSSGAIRFDEKTYDDPALLAQQLAERMATGRRSEKSRGRRLIFHITLSADKDARIGRVMSIQQALSKLPACDAVSFQLSDQDVVASDAAAREGLQGRWRPVFSMRGELHQLLDRDESFTFDDDQLILRNRDGTTKFDVSVAAGSPMSIDVRTKDGRTTRGIVARHGDIAVICWDQSLASQRPQEFDASVSPDRVLIVLKRDKMP